MCFEIIMQSRKERARQCNTLIEGSVEKVNRTIFKTKNVIINIFFIVLASVMFKKTFVISNKRFYSKLTLSASYKL